MKKLLAIILSAALLIGVSACAEAPREASTFNEDEISEEEATSGAEETEEDEDASEEEDVSEEEDELDEDNLLICETALEEDLEEPAETSENAEEELPDYHGSLEARDFKFVALNFVCKDFIVPAERNFTVGDSVGDEGPMKYNNAADMIYALYQQEASLSPYKFSNASANPNGFLISENGDFWFNVSHITASFTMEDLGSEYPFTPNSLTWAQPYVQMGSGAEVGAKWEWYLNDLNPDLNLIHVNNNVNNPVIDTFEDHVFTVKWDFAEAYEYFGETRPIKGNTEDENWRGGNGFQKFGIQFGRNIDDYDAYDTDFNVRFNWVDVQIYVYDLDKFMDYINTACELSGETLDPALLANIHEVD